MSSYMRCYEVQILRHLVFRQLLLTRYFWHGLMHQNSYVLSDMYGIIEGRDFEGFHKIKKIMVRWLTEDGKRQVLLT